MFTPVCRQRKTLSGARRRFRRLHATRCSTPAYITSPSRSSGEEHAGSAGAPRKALDYASPRCSSVQSARGLANAEFFQDLEVVLQRHGSHNTHLAKEQRRHSRDHEAIDRFFVLLDGQLLPLTACIIRPETLDVELAFCGDREDLIGVRDVHPPGKKGLKKGVMHALIGLFTLE